MDWVHPRGGLAVGPPADDREVRPCCSVGGYAVLGTPVASGQLGTGDGDG